MIAVKTKARLQSMSNMALACLALTDVMVGLVVQPLFIAQIWNIIQGETTASACSMQIASKLFNSLFCLSSIVHLSLISVDRYIAIMRPYIYIQTVTKRRVLIATALAWTLTLIINTAVLLIDVEMVRAIITAVVISLIAVVVFCNIIVYREAHRQEKQIAAQQVDMATKEKILSHKRAFKLTLMIITLTVISYFPGTIFVRFKEPLKNVVSLGTLTSIFMVVGSLAAFNSLVNPFIYCIRLRQFRHLSDLAYAVLVALIVIHATTCPFTILLNLLVMIAVKTKPRLQSMSNITLACLASTDTMVGLVVQPLLITLMVNLIQGKTTAGVCSV
ncbi:unnamed protein product [Porites evermanni]|uniref:G-protein coupled receptors family 1 profile domain-containing protein n=1 Tax=Porites evermanni TaxID=104178 RepID=A0ABN8QNB5_9CNID|nr:unnamed protein product [Porites evermanni]